MSPSPVDVIAEWLADEDAWCLDLPSNCRGAGRRVVAALEAAGYRIVHESELAALPADSPAAERSDHPGTQTPDEPARDVQHGDIWMVINGRTVIVPSSPWPPPKPGTHESDLYGYLEMRGMDPSDIRGYLRMRGLNLSGSRNLDGWIRGGAIEYITAARWSRAHRQS